MVRFLPRNKLFQQRHCKSITFYCFVKHTDEFLSKSPFKWKLMTRNIEHFLSNTIKHQFVIPLLTHTKAVTKYKALLIFMIAQICNPYVFRKIIHKTSICERFYAGTFLCNNSSRLAFLIKFCLQMLKRSTDSLKNLINLMGFEIFI